MAFPGDRFHDPGLEARDRKETEVERLDRNLTELLNELRVALPGVQVLFAFLLVAPFNQGFQKVSDFERKLYFATLLCTALSSILLIAPSMHHRLLFRQRQKPFLVTTANRLTIAGLAMLALAMTGAVLLVTHVLFGGIPAGGSAMAIEDGDERVAEQVGGLRGSGLGVVGVGAVEAVGGAPTQDVEGGRVARAGDPHRVARREDVADHVLGQAVDEPKRRVHV